MAADRRPRRAASGAAPWRLLPRRHRPAEFAQQPRRRRSPRCGSWRRFGPTCMASRPRLARWPVSSAYVAHYREVGDAVDYNAGRPGGSWATCTTISPRRLRTAARRTDPRAARHLLTSRVRSLATPALSRAGSREGPSFQVMGHGAFRFRRTRAVPEVSDAVLDRSRRNPLATRNIPAGGVGWIWTNRLNPYGMGFRRRQTILDAAGRCRTEFRRFSPPFLPVLPAGAGKGRSGTKDNESSAKRLFGAPQ